MHPNSPQNKPQSGASAPSVEVAISNGTDHRVEARAVQLHAQTPARPKPRPIKFALTQLGNAERLVHLHGDDIRWCPAWKSWLVWNQRRWRIDTNGEIDRMAHSTIRDMAQEAKKVQDLELQKAIRQFAKRSETNHNFAAMIDLAKTVEAGISVTPQELDAHTMLLNCRNGVIDLQTGGLIRHRNAKKFLLTKQVHVEYQPSAQCRTWIKFLTRIFNGDSALIDYIQKIIGYSLTGAVTEKALFLFHGDGDNGKTTLLETIRHMMGDYAGLVELDALMLGSQDSARERAIADLHGKRFVTASESEAGQRFREATIKRLTGMGRLVGRRLYSNAFEFDPEFKLFIDANHKPQIKGTDEAMWTRMRLIPFTVTIPEKEKDKQLGQKLRAELPGILAWAVRGCLAWQKDGLDAPTAVKKASAAYREEMDLVSVFVGDCCEKTADAREGATKLYEGFCKWCRDIGEKEPITQTAFGLRLKNLGYESHRTTAGNEWVGLRLLPGLAKRTPIPTRFNDVNLSMIDPTWIDPAWELEE